MPIEDVDYLIKNSNPDSYIVKVDSSLRKKSQFPQPSEFTIHFDNPFRYVYGIDVLDASMPSSMFNIESFNNIFKYHLIWRNPHYDADMLTENSFMNSFFYDVDRINRLKAFLDKKENNRIIFVDGYSHVPPQSVSEGVLDENCIAIRNIISGLPFRKVDVIDFDQDVTYFLIGDGVFSIQNLYKTTIDTILRNQDLKIATITVSEKMRDKEKVYRYLSYEIPIVSKTSSSLPKVIHIIEDAHTLSTASPENRHLIPLRLRSGKLLTSSTFSHLIYLISDRFHVWDETFFLSSALSSDDKTRVLDVVSKSLSSPSHSSLSRVLLNGIIDGEDIGFLSPSRLIRDTKINEKIFIPKSLLSQINVVQIMDERIHLKNMMSSTDVAIKLDLKHVMLFQVRKEGQIYDIDEVASSSDGIYAFRMGAEENNEGNESEENEENNYQLYVLDQSKGTNVNDPDENIQTDPDETAKTVFLQQILSDDDFIEIISYEASVFEFELDSTRFIKFRIDGTTYQIPFGSTDVESIGSIGSVIRIGRLSTTYSLPGPEGETIDQGYSKLKLPFQSVKDNFLIDARFYLKESKGVGTSIDRNRILYGAGEQLLYWDTYAYNAMEELERKIIDERLDESFTLIDIDVRIIQEAVDGTYYYDIEYQNKVYVIASRLLFSQVTVATFDVFVDQISPTSLGEDLDIGRGIFFLVLESDKFLLFLLLSLPLMKLKADDDENKNKDENEIKSTIDIFAHPDKGALDLFEDPLHYTLFSYDALRHRNLSSDPLHAAYIKRVLNDVENLLLPEVTSIVQGGKEIDQNSRPYCSLYRRFAYEDTFYHIPATFLVHVKHVRHIDIGADPDGIIYREKEGETTATSIHVRLPLRHIASEDAEGYITNKEIEILYQIENHLFVWSSRPMNSLESFQYRQRGYVYVFFTYILDVLTNSFLQIGTNGAQTLNTQIKLGVKETALIEFTVSDVVYELFLMLDVLVVDKMALRVMRDKEGNSFFDVFRSLLNTIVYYDLRFITNVEYTNIVKNSNFIQGELNYDTAPLEWTPAILFNGRLEIETANYDAFTLLDELNEGFERAVAINLRLDTGTRSVTFPFIDTNSNISARKKTRNGDVSRSGQLKFVTGKENLSFMIDLERSTIRDVIGFSVLNDKNNIKKLESVQRYERGGEGGEINARIRTRMRMTTIKSLPRERIDIQTLKEIEGQEIIPPGVINLLGIRYVVLRCPEIESLIGTHSFGSSMPGIGVFVLGLNQQTIKQRLDFVHYVRKPFHPIEKLHKLTFRFEIKDGSPYDFKGVDMFMILQVNTYAPVKKTDFDHKQSILQPNYNPDFIQYRIDEAKKIESQYEYTRSLSDDEEEYDSEEANDVVKIQNQFDHSDEEEEEEEEGGEEEEGIFDPQNIRIF